MAWALRHAALAALKGCKNVGGVQEAVRGAQQPMEQVLSRMGQQTRGMGGGGAGAPWHRSYDGKPPPIEFQSPDFVTYAGLTLPKQKQDWDYWSSKAMGAVLWFTLFYHFALNWEEHYYGDIGVFEHDVQKNGWDDHHGHESHEEGGHGEEAAEAAAEH
ncbi:hypothetical protein DUNSADRAFT_9798 [Dunaliella salina]|uniref:Uncharacterized protein n=1 Tax=Dunaliella salina TaxID=3046 RepID=A0ABQ7GGP7_DUNSA|nr:hypothetical protein DUNSADRAFT_9798 [Dunaliella salina]|eukprot:KAF5833774.1 hypothetical protein DUNSADRAFT_9798 [Dunaliella salina]